MSGLSYQVLIAQSAPGVQATVAVVLTLVDGLSAPPAANVFELTSLRPLITKTGRLVELTPDFTLKTALAILALLGM